MHKLKPLQIKNAAVGKYADGGGLYFVKTVESAKWIYRFSIGGKRREMGLGPYPAVGLADARRERDKWATVLRQGKDPIIEREAQRQQALAEMKKEDPTFEELALMVFEGKKAGLRGEGKRGRWMSPINNHLIPKFGKRRVSQINQLMVADALRPIWKTQYPTAEKAYQRLRIIFTSGKLMGFKTDPFIVDAAIHMLGEVNHVPENLPATAWQDIPKLYARLDPDQISHRVLKLIIFTAARLYPARAATRDEFEGDVWTVPEERMKGREGKVEDFRIPLSVQAQDDIAAWIKETDSQFLFSHKEGQPISDAAVEKALRELGEEGTPHGFRTSFRTWVQDTKAGTYDAAETQLAHIVGKKVERAYARSDLLEERRILMQKWADYVTGTEAKIVRLRG